MNSIKLIFSVSLFLAFQVNVWAYSVSAGIREYYTSIAGNNYGGDDAARMKLEVFKTGAQSMTLQLRFGVMKPDDSVLFNPVLRTTRDQLEVMVSRIAHGNGLAVFKPMIYVNPGLGAPSSLPELRPTSLDTVMTSYEQILNVYRSSAALRSIDEFVLGAGLGRTYTAELSARWKAILQNFKASLNPATSISLELSNESALVNLENFQTTDPGRFYDTWAAVDKIRFTLPVQEYLDPATLVLNPLKLKSLMLNRMERIHHIFPNRKIGFSNVTLPACAGFASDESEITCTATKYQANQAQAQADALKLFFETLDEVDVQTGNVLDSVEVMVTSTESEPLAENADLRYLLYHPFARKVLEEHLKIKNHHSSEVDSPARSFLPPSESPGVVTKLACIYFDEMNAKDMIGAIHARMLETLIGAFPDWRRERRSIRYYQSQDLKSCDAVFYLASNFVLNPPASFYPDLSVFAQDHTVAWFNYKFDHFSKDYAELSRQRTLHKQEALGSIDFSVPYTLQPDQPPTAEKPDPGFYRYFEYKGETFEKQATWDPVTHIYSNSPELGYIQVHPSAAVSVKVLAQARHSISGNKTPYIVQQSLGQRGALFYIADLPFSFIHYEDRYLIFCDVIYDILKEPTPNRKPVALVRLEDINPSIAVENMTWVIDYLSDHSIPYSMALIPLYSSVFYDPLTGAATSLWKPVDQYPQFVGTLKYAKARGAQFVFHGVAHQAGDLISGIDGSSGSDYEFWDWPNDAPLPQEDPEWVIKRLELGESVLNRLHIRPVAWEVPHYAASAMDYSLFGKLFEWNYHRAISIKSEVKQDVTLDSKYGFFNCSSKVCRSKRIDLAKKLNVTADYKTFGTQIIPYPIYQDTYGQSLIPESVGMVDFAMYTPSTWRPVSFPADVLRRARKLKVIRGAMASFFWHPVLLNKEDIYYREVEGSYDKVGGTASLITIIEGLKELGYEFRSIADCDLFPRKDCKTPRS